MTIYGSDVSHYDAVDTRAMFAQGIVFQTHKAGGDALDAELGNWWSLVKSYRSQVLLGAYWVLYPGNPYDRADAFIARLDSQCPGWRDGPFILQADCERWNGDQSTVPSVAEINAFCDRLTDRMPKLRPIGYLPDWVYGDISKFRYPLWSSKYVIGTGGFKSLYPGDGSSKWASYGGKAPDVLQYSSSATIGGQTTCDANAYRGTLVDLTRLLAPGWIQEEEADMPIDQTDLNTFFKTDNTVPTPSNASDYATNKGRSMAESLTNVEYHTRQAETNAWAAHLDADGINAKLDQLLALAGAEAAEVPPTAQQNADAVLAALGDVQTPEEIADILRPVLGDKAAAVGVLLSTPDA
jgi:hypothetical protein